MSELGFLEKLLDGAEVAWVPLGDLEDSGIVKLGRGNVISKNDLANAPGEFPVYSSSASDRGEFGRYGKFMFDDERLTWSIDGGGRFFYRSPHKYSVTNVCGWLSVLEVGKLSTRYLYHYLSAAWANKVFDYTKKAHPSVIRKEYSIPIPCPEEPEKSVAIQGEIVRILDSFTELTAELTAELEARKKQYNHYRDQLLTFEGEDVRWAKFVDVADFRRGTAITKKETAEGDVPVVANGPVPSYSHAEHNRQGETVVVARSGAYAGYVSYWNQPIFLTDAFSVHPHPEAIIPKFVYHVLQNKQAQLHAMKKGAGVPHVRVKEMEQYDVPVPSLDTQYRIVEILDTFDTLTTSLSEGLPREIELRQKQYEYYRDLLLSFPKPAEAAEA